MAEFEPPAIAFRQGQRDVYSSVIDLEEVKRYLPLCTAEDSNHIKDTNRALVRSHTRKIEAYLAETDNWVLPAITLAATSDNARFTAHDCGDVGIVKSSNELELSVFKPEGTATSSQGSRVHGPRPVSIAS